MYVDPLVLAAAIVTSGWLASRLYLWGRAHGKEEALSFCKTLQSRRDLWVRDEYRAATGKEIWFPDDKPYRLAPDPERSASFSSK